MSGRPGHTADRSASTTRRRAHEPPSHDDSVDLVGIGLFVVSLAPAAALVLAAHSPDLGVALTAVACLSMVAFLATFRLNAPPGSAGTRRILATLLSLVVVAVFLEVSARTCPRAASNVVEK